VEAVGQALAERVEVAERETVPVGVSETSQRQQKTFCP